MQLLLIFGIAFAVAAVAFALQNNVPVTVSLLFWSFDSSLAMVLLLAIGLGAIIAGLVSSPAVIRGQWATARLRREVAALEADKAGLVRRVGALEAELKLADSPAEFAPEQPKPYVGLKTLLTAGGKPGSDREA
jgi:uncharacterized integral membrane protein